MRRRDSRTPVAPGERREPPPRGRTRIGIAVVALSLVAGACFGDDGPGDPSSAPSSTAGNPEGPNESDGDAPATTTSRSTDESCRDFLAANARGSTDRIASYKITLRQIIATAPTVDLPGPQNPQRPRENTGVNALLRSGISSIVLGTEDPKPGDPVPDDDRLAQLIFEFGEPLSVGDACAADLTGGVLSTTDARVGTSADINGRKFVQAGPGRVTLIALDGSYASGIASLLVTEEFLSPITAPRYEGLYKVTAGFVAVDN